tara:strand:+ start:547 stop:924 length:378 start_codon:yes stop_codon:yes gene_type:complete
MRLIILFLLFSTNLHASSFWSDINEGVSEKYNEQSINLEGILIYAKKFIRARDNFYKLRIKDPNSKKFVEVKYYTIRRLKRINFFNCKEGQTITIKGHFRSKNKKNLVGLIKMDSKAKKFICKDL